MVKLKCWRDTELKITLKAIYIEYEMFKSRISVIFIYENRII